ncbi:MAG TPA: sulfatase [Candidatus Handelsmanbacteria bacterium]|nr:sulfatase [Candidatus Handelsmanbacteria bacterium]
MPPNILYLHSHDTGRYVSPMGHAVDTPNIQGLAEQGMLFRKCFCAAPTCSPSRAALLTGQSAHSSGMLGLAHRGFSLHDYSQHLVSTLKGAGYRTILAGMQHVGDGVGYDEALGADNRQARNVSAAAVEYLDGAPKQPFFLDVGYGETHLPFPEMSQQDSRYVRVPDPLPDTPETRRMMAGYHESVRRMDEGHGRVLEGLERNGLAQNTLVVCTTDHGVPFPGMKCHLTDHGMGVYLIIRGPGGFTGGTVCDALVSHVDLYPTICEVAGITAPTHLQGVSLLPLVRDPAAVVRDELFAEVNYHAAYDPGRAVRTDRWKLIIHYDGEMTTPVLANCDDSEAKSVWLEHGWAQRPVAAERLYDVIFDPNESCNFAADPGHAMVLEEMRVRLHRWMEATDDPLLEGPVAAPKGARINDKHGGSPRDAPGVVE